MRRICVFDVNETLLDLSVLDPYFEKNFGDKAIRKEWFSQFIQSAFVSIITNHYTEFGIIGKAALEIVSQKHNIQLSEEKIKEILSKMLTLPPHPEIAESLEKLKKAGFHIAALTNSTKTIAEKQLTNAKLVQYFEKILSANQVKRLKPVKEAYKFAAQSFRVPTNKIRLIAAHNWDIVGALRAGCSAAFIARPGMVLDPLGEKPDIVGKNLKEVVDAIIEKEK